LNQHIYQRRPTGNSALPTVVFALLVANGLAFAAQQVQPNLVAFYLETIQEIFGILMF